MIEEHQNCSIGNGRTSGRLEFDWVTEVTRFYILLFEADLF